MFRAELARDTGGILPLAFRQAGAHCGHADGARSERTGRGGEHDRAVDAARIANQDRAELAQEREQVLELGRGLKRRHQLRHNMLRRRGPEPPKGVTRGGEPARPENEPKAGALARAPRQSRRKPTDFALAGLSAETSGSAAHARLTDGQNYIRWFSPSQ